MECPRCSRPTASCSCAEGQQRRQQQPAPSSGQAPQNPPGTSPRRHASGPANTQTAPSPQPRQAGSAGQQTSRPPAAHGAGPSRDPSLRAPSTARQQTSGPAVTHGTAPSHTPPPRARPVRSVGQEAPGPTAAHGAGPRSAPPLRCSPAGSARRQQMWRPTTFHEPTSFGGLSVPALSGGSAGQQTSHPATSHVNTPSQVSATGSAQPRNTPPAASRGRRGSRSPGTGSSGRQAVHPAAALRPGGDSQSPEPGPFCLATVSSAEASGTGVLVFDIVQVLAIWTRRAEQSRATLGLFLESIADDHNGQVASRHPQMEVASDLPQSAVWSVAGCSPDLEAPSTTVECKSLPLRHSYRLSRQAR
jgi:hypothetical protein